MKHDRLMNWAQASQFITERTGKIVYQASVDKWLNQHTTFGGYTLCLLTEYVAALSGPETKVVSDTNTTLYRQDNSHESDNRQAIGPHLLDRGRSLFVLHHRRNRRTRYHMRVA